MFQRRFKNRAFLFLIVLTGVTSVTVLFTRGMQSYGFDNGDPESVLPGVGEIRPAPAEPAMIPPFLEFVEFMDRELDSSLTVGAAYTVANSGNIACTRTFGETRTGSGEKVDEHTLFRLASVSKGFAGVLACMLDMEGAVSLDDRILDHYPGFRLKDSANTAGMTIRHLLSHSSGLVPYAFDNLVEAGEDLPQIVSRLHEVDISAPPGALYGYQNVLFSMFDPIARKATGVPYEVLMEELIFKPLGMSDASVGMISTGGELNMAWPHVRTGTGYASLKPHTGYYNVLPAAGVNASISDLERWLIALLGHAPEVFPDTIGRILAEPVIYTPLKSRYTRYWKPFRGRYYSLGWRIYDYRGRKIIYHGGYIRGYRAEIGYCPEEDVGIAFLQNSPNSLASKVTPRFFDLFFDYLDRSGKEFAAIAGE